MNSEINVTLIASITSLLIALVSIVTAYLNHRFVRKEKKESVKHKNIGQVIEALDSVNIAIQVFKDTVIYIATGSFYNKEEAIKKIIEDTGNIVKVYEKAFVNLEGEDMKNAHILKNKIIGFSKIIQHKLYDYESVYKLSENDKIELLALKDSLTETQDMLLKQKHVKLKALY